MATDFPTSLQDLDATRGTDNDPLSNPNHATHHQTEDDTIEALQAKVGIDGSAVTSSHDYKLSGVTGSDTAASLAGTETLTNKTIDGNNNTISNLAHGAEVDEPSSGVHGVTGSVVGTTDTQTLTNKTLTDATNSFRAASTTTDGAVELATIAETDTGTDATRAVTPDGLQGSKRNIRYLVFSLVESTTDVAVDTSIGGDFTIPFSGTILQDDTDHDQLAATTDTAGTTGTMVVDIHLNGTTIMTTNKLDIETTEKGTQTAATQPDLTTTSISAGDILTFDVDAIHTTPAKGLKVYMAIRED